MAKFRHDFQIPAERLIPITRGGAAVWYDTPTGLELFAMRTPQDVRVENRLQQQRTGLLKQMHVTPWDRQVLRDAADTLGLRRYHTLHPAWMYQTLEDFWDARRGLTWLQDRVRFTTLPAFQLAGVTLPPAFVAVRYYFRSTLPATPTVVAFAKHSIQLLAQAQPVVILTSGHALDDHLDYVPKDLPNVTVLSDLVSMTPQDNLAVQAAVLQRALGFVGTYGGMAQLALRLGKPSVSVYDEWHGTAPPHKHLSEALSRQMGVGFHVVRIGDVPQLQAALPRVTRGA